MNEMPKKHSLDYSIDYLKQERRRLSTERDVANSNKDYESAKQFEWLVTGLDSAINLLEHKKSDTA
jgi:hypothetical protein